MSIRVPRKEEGRYLGNQARRVVGKRRTLGEVSSLGLYSINLCQVDLSKLVRGQALTLLYTISKNRFGIKTHALIDTRANGFVFIDLKLASLAT